MTTTIRATVKDEQGNLIHSSPIEVMTIEDNLDILRMTVETRESMRDIQDSVGKLIAISEESIKLIHALRERIEALEFEGRRLRA